MIYVDRGLSESISWFPPTRPPPTLLLPCRSENAIERQPSNSDGTPSRNATLCSRCIRTKDAADLLRTAGTMGARQHTIGHASRRSQTCARVVPRDTQATATSTSGCLVGEFPCILLFFIHPIYSASALLFSLPPINCRNADPGPHSRLSPPPSPLRLVPCIFFTREEDFSALYFLIDARRMHVRVSNFRALSQLVAADPHQTGPKYAYL